VTITKARKRQQRLGDGLGQPERGSSAGFAGGTPVLPWVRRGPSRPAPTGWWRSCGASPRPAC